MSSIKITSIEKVNFLYNLSFSSWSSWCLFYNILKRKTTVKLRHLLKLRPFILRRQTTVNLRQHLRQLLLQWASRPAGPRLCQVPAVARVYATSRVELVQERHDVDDMIVTSSPLWASHASCCLVCTAMGKRQGRPPRRATELAQGSSGHALAQSH